MEFDLVKFTAELAGRLVKIADARGAGESVGSGLRSAGQSVGEGGRAVGRGISEAYDAPGGFVRGLAEGLLPADTPTGLDPSIFGGSPRETTTRPAVSTGGTPTRLPSGLPALSPEEEFGLEQEFGHRPTSGPGSTLGGDWGDTPAPQWTPEQRGSFVQGLPSGEGPLSTQDRDRLGYLLSTGGGGITPDILREVAQRDPAAVAGLGDAVRFSMGGGEGSIFGRVGAAGRVAEQVNAARREQQIQARYGMGPAAAATPASTPAAAAPATPAAAPAPRRRDVTPPPTPVPTASPLATAVPSPSAGGPFAAGRPATMPTPLTDPRTGQPFQSRTLQELQAMQAERQGGAKGAPGAAPTSYAKARSASETGQAAAVQPPIGAQVGAPPGRAQAPILPVGPSPPAPGRAGMVNQASYDPFNPELATARASRLHRDFLGEGILGTLMVPLIGKEAASQPHARMLAMRAFQETMGDLSALIMNNKSEYLAKEASAAVAGTETTEQKIAQASFIGRLVAKDLFIRTLSQVDQHLPILVGS